MADRVRVDAEKYKKLEQIAEKQKRQYSKQNEYIREHYWRPSVTLPKEYKKRLEAVGIGAGDFNGFFRRLVEQELIFLEGR